MADWRIFAWVHSSSAFRVSAMTQDFHGCVNWRKEAAAKKILSWIHCLLSGWSRDSGGTRASTEVASRCDQLPATGREEATTVERGQFHLSPSCPPAHHQPSSVKQATNNSSLSLTLSARTTLASVGGALGISVILGRVQPPLSFLLQRNSLGDISSESSLFVWGASGLVFRYWWRAKRKKGRRLFLHVRQSILKRLCSSSRDGLTFTKLFSFPHA